MLTLSEEHKPVMYFEEPQGSVLQTMKSYRRPKKMLGTRLIIRKKFGTFKKGRDSNLQRSSFNECQL